MPFYYSVLPKISIQGSIKNYFKRDLLLKSFSRIAFISIDHNNRQKFFDNCFQFTKSISLDSSRNYLKDIFAIKIFRRSIFAPINLIYWQ
jgi:hypothetical protein